MDIGIRERAHHAAPCFEVASRRLILGYTGRFMSSIVRRACPSGPR